MKKIWIWILANILGIRRISVLKITGEPELVNGGFKYPSELEKVEYYVFWTKVRTVEFKKDAVADRVIKDENPLTREPDFVYRVRGREGIREQIRHLYDIGFISTAEFKQSMELLKQQDEEERKAWEANKGQYIAGVDPFSVDPISIDGKDHVVGMKVIKKENK